jgi:hypothetical protein
VTCGPPPNTGHLRTRSGRSSSGTSNTGKSRWAAADAPTAPGASTSTPRCPLLRTEPAQLPRLLEIRDNLLARIDEARKHGWLGEVDGLNVSLSAANNKIAQLEESARRTTDLGMPRFHDVAPHTITPNTGPHPDPGV